jgi:vancomycin resistance protein VanJ
MQRRDDRRPAASAQHRCSDVWLRRILFLYGFLYVGFWFVVWLCGDRTWFGTLLLFSPRHLLAAPLVVPAALTLIGRRWQRAASSAIVVFGLLGVCRLNIPWRFASADAAERIRVVSLNSARFPKGPALFQAFVESAAADVVVMQEVDITQPVEWPADWSVCVKGELLIASRYPLTAETSVRRQLPGRWPRTIALFATVDAPGSTFRVGTTHLLSPRPGLSEIVDSKTLLNLSKRSMIDEEIRRRRSESEHVVEASSNQGDNLIIAGDFNLPPDSNIYRAHWRHFQNAFCKAGFGFGNTVFVKQGPFTFSSRIDHVLFTNQWQCAGCWVGPDVGSDHLPLIADLQQ